MSMEPLWITEDEVVSLLSLTEAIPALERGLEQEARGASVNMNKTHAIWGEGNTLHAIGAVMGEDQIVGTKTWAHTAGGACPLLILFDGATGALAAIIEAFALGQMRTAAISAVATKWMAAEAADDMAIVGTGKQALTQVAGVHAVRPLRRLRVFSPRPESRAAFVAKLRGIFPFEVSAVETAEAAIEGASVVTLITRAREPVLTAAMLGRGSHLNAVGAITPERQEFAQDVFDRCGAIAVDAIESTARLSREFKDRFGSDASRWLTVRPLSTLVAERRGRPTDADVTLFKAMGMGLSDVALGIDILARARAAGVGRVLSQPGRAQPRLI